MLCRVPFAVTIVVGLLGLATDANALEFKGNPFTEPISLAGTWHYIDEDLSPAEAASADLSTWPTMEVPGRRPGSALGPIGWYGIDVQIPQRGQWPETMPELVLAPPFFLLAYEVYVGDRLLGASGAMPPSPRMGPLRHRWFALPRDVLPEDGRIAVRVRVWGGSVPFRGTGLRCTSEAICLGPRRGVDVVVALANERQRSARPWEPYLAGGMLALALVFGTLGLALRQDRAYAWLSIWLGAHGTGTLLMHDVGSYADVQSVSSIISAVGALGILAALKLFRALLDLDNRFAKGLTWTAGGLLAARVVVVLVDRTLTALDLAGMGFLIVSGGYVLVTSLRKAHRGVRDAGLVAAGVVVAAVCWLAGPVLTWMTASRGSTSPVLFLLSALPDLGLALLAMTISVVVARRYARSIADLQASFVASHRFVPERFLSLLGRKKITEVQRADATEQKMAILFADIRGFTTRSEAAGAEAIFALVNRYLEAIEPAIHEHDGFINKFLGDGILALFPDAAAGLAGARDLQRAVVALNQELAREGEEPIRVGIGLHTGTVMLGTVGGKRQLDTSVIADAVNTASRVESLTKRYGVDILTTSTALEEAGSTGGGREIDRVVVKGRQEPITLHEVYWQQDDHANRDGAYADALEKYQQGNLTDALAGFVALAESDPAARRMARETEKLIERGLPNPWDGVVRLDEK